MSTSQLFALRSKLKKNSLEEFKKMVRQQKIRLEDSLSHLFLTVYQHQTLKKQMMQYLAFFAEYDPKMLNIEIDRRRLLEQLCFLGKFEDVKELLYLFVTMDVSLKLYHIHQLVFLALQGKNSAQTVISVVNILNNFRKHFREYDSEDEKQKDSYACLYALQQNLLLPAYEILKLDIGRLERDNKELFTLPAKINKKDIKILESFVRLYIQKTKCNPYIKDARGKTFLDYLPKDIQSILEECIVSYQNKIQSREPVRRSENKVRSTIGQGQHFKQYNSQALHDASNQKVVINLQNSQDQLFIQRQANKIYQNIIIQKEKHLRYQKKQRKEGQQKQKRVGIMKSEELRYYLEEDIKSEVEAIKQENRQYKCHFVELINKLKQKLTAPLQINLQVFGSFKTELCLQQSDIDIAITSSNKQFQMNPLKLLGEIQFILQQEEMKQYIQSVKFIKTATVPIIKVTCSQKYWGKKIDFTYQDVEHNGLQSVELIRSYINQYPQLQSLIFVLKKFIYIANLSAPYLGGISSYGLILMIVAFIQQEYKNHEGEGQKLLTADLLIGFLKFYGFKMNYVMKCIQIFDKNKTSWQNYTGCLSRYNQPNGLIDVTPKLVIIDPLNQNNNVGRATHKIKQIQMAFEIAYISIHTFRQCGKKRKCASFRNIAKLQINDIKYADNVRPCCILKRMFSCTEKFIKE